MNDRFDYRMLVDELRCRPTEWLRARRAELVGEQRRLRIEELAVVAVLDDRGAIDDTDAAADGVSTRSLREAVETARTLEDLPQVAAAAHAGVISAEQLAPLARLADAESDAEWAPAGLELRAGGSRPPGTHESEAGRRRRACPA